MKIGMSIQSEALQANIPDKMKRIYLASFPSLELYIEFLRSLGVSSIEVRIYNQQAAYEDFREALTMIKEKGMNITIHGELSHTEVGSRVNLDYPSLPPLLESLKQPVIMPIHASQGYEETVDYAARTMQILQTWGNELNNSTRQIQFSIENNRVKKVLDPGNTISGVLNIIESMNREDVGICWDMGHYYSNLLHGKEHKPTIFEEDILLNTFCRRVVHTHIHSTNNEWTTHFPITKESRFPLHSFVQLLEQNSYQGIYNLELSLERWPTEVDAKRAIAKSIHYLQNTIALCRKGTK